jgi:D-alanyl-lipoteichoic acid acyltransferase DltB (MBOAT superfamily)
MSYTSWNYYAMVIVLIIAYYALPKKIRWISLLAGSVFFYTQLIYRKKQIAIFICSIVVSYIAGIVIEKIRNKDNKFLKRAVLAISILLTALPLLLEKLGDFMCGSVLHITKVSWIIPVGLSFYTLQLIAYMVDVYNGKTKAQLNPLKYGLFASFFPQIIQGPIPRYEKLNKELFEGNDYSFDNIIAGIQLVIWGFFLKYMIADKAAVIVNSVFDHYHAYSGGYIWIAGILYSMQLYADFLSCTTMSQGVAEMFGIHLDNNFMHPYFSTSIKDFWRRWHMSLSKWLRDYIYIPLGGNRKGKYHKWLNILITFAVSGLWHGGRWKFLIWGLLHALYQIIGEVKDSLIDDKWIDTKSKRRVWIVFQRVVTFLLVMVAWIIFRADTFQASIEMIRTMIVGYNPWIWFDDSLFRLGLNWKECAALAFSIGVLFLVSYEQEKGRQLRKWISSQNIIVRWGIYLLAIWTIWICGSYGFGFDAKDFIYGGF